MNQLWNRENADYSAMVEQIPFNGIFCHSDISELLDMATLFEFCSKTRIFCDWGL